MNFLKKIIVEKKCYVQKCKAKQPLDRLIKEVGEQSAESRFRSVLAQTGVHLIAEIKRASPSKGDLNPNLDVVRVARMYEQAGVQLISVLTEEKFFKGSLADLALIAQSTKAAVLCKDFIIDEYQMYQAKKAGADAILLIAALLSQEQLRGLLCVAKELSLDVVVEVHTQEELARVLDVGSAVEIIGINHRTLVDFSIDLSVSKDLIPLIPQDKLIIAESGLETVDDIKLVVDRGVNGILIGESLMKADNIQATVQSFVATLSQGQ